MDTPTPDPNAPAPEEGLRPEADPSVVRPEQVEENGPLPGLLDAAAEEALDEATPTDGEGLGVEDEGIESGQILGLSIAILASVAALAIVVYFLFYETKLDDTRDQAMADMAVLPEAMTNRAEAEAAMGAYGMTADSTYRMPIESAMEMVMEEYGGATAGSLMSDSAMTVADSDAPATRAGFNTAMVRLDAMPATTSMAPMDEAYAAPVPMEDATGSVETTETEEASTE